MPTIKLKEVGEVQAKSAGEFKPGDIVQQAYGYTLKIEKIIFETADNITFLVEHVPEECEFWDGAYNHQETYQKNELLGIAVRHGNEGLC